jgi:hypothetical protein
MIYNFNDEKNEILFKERRVTFQHVIDSISENGILLDFKHPNIIKYPKQRIFVVELFEYTYCIPYVENENVIYMKTIFPSRKFLYLLENK